MSYSSDPGIEEVIEFRSVCSRLTATRDSTQYRSYIHLCFTLHTPLPLSVHHLRLRLHFMKKSLRFFTWLSAQFLHKNISSSYWSLILATPGCYYWGFSTLLRNVLPSTCPGPGWRQLSCPGPTVILPWTWISCWGTWIYLMVENICWIRMSTRIWKQLPTKRLYFMTSQVFEVVLCLNFYDLYHVQIRCVRRWLWA